MYQGDATDADQAGADRDRTAEDRDERGAAHDEESAARDGRAQARDERAEAREVVADGADAGAASDRAGALRDRRGGASDRTQAADDREAAAADRSASARERAASHLDELTGAHLRGPGTVELAREMDRAKRTKQPLTLAFVDIDGLKGKNDSLGHAAGDQLLRGTVASIRAHLRPYDLIVRYGGDEFLCVLLDVPLAAAAKRFELTKADLSANHAASFTVGLTELDAADGPEDLIERADAALYEARALARKEVSGD